MSLQSRIYLKDNLQIPSQEYLYKLSGMGGKGTLQLIRGYNDQDQLCIYMKCEAGISKLIPFFKFEGLSIWERGENELVFQSFEEKDSSKNIYKKWELFNNCIQYYENRNGLEMDREIHYSVTNKDINRAFDPLSLIALLTLEKFEDQETKKFYLFGKRELAHLELYHKQTNGNQEVIGLRPQQGLSENWRKALENAEIIREKDRIVEIVVPTPFLFGKVKMKLQDNHEVSTPLSLTLS